MTDCRIAATVGTGYVCRLIHVLTAGTVVVEIAHVADGSEMPFTAFVYDGDKMLEGFATSELKRTYRYARSAARRAMRDRRAMVAFQPRVNNTGVQLV